MLKVCLDDGELLQLLTAAAEDFARASVPQEIFRAFQKAHMTALAKKDGGVRGIATGTSFRRLVAKSLARQFAKEVESVCAQFALSTRAGTDCVGHAVRAMTDAHSTSTVLSIDGIGAYDHVFRSAMLSKLHSEPRLHGLLPFVRAMYSDPSQYSWRDAAGTQHVILQCEGGEQGDPLMPLLFSLAIHDALAETKDALEDGEELLAFLDDIYAISEPGRTRAVYNTLAEKLATKAGIHLHTGKTRVWNQEGVCLPNLEDLGPDVWSSRGVKILGTPVGSDDFVQELCEERLRSENDLWDAIPIVPDLQCACRSCCSARAHVVTIYCGPSLHTSLRVMLPLMTQVCAEPW